MECPSQKRCYAERASAEAARKRMGGNGRAYRCGCGWYHVTSSAHRRGGMMSRRARKRARQRAWRD